VRQTYHQNMCNLSQPESLSCSANDGRPPWCLCKPRPSVVWTVLVPLQFVPSLGGEWPSLNYI
jgi:hypothetical protein